MKTVLISGTGTEIGKTYIARKLVQHLSSNNSTVQFIKAVETGVEPNEEVDALFISNNISTTSLSTHTLFSYKYPMAPYDAARLENKELKYCEVLKQIQDLPSTFDYRIIEGAGGIAVPLDKDPKYDWLKLAQDLEVDLLLLVVKEELGAINQTRLVYKYCTSSHSKTLRTKVFLNQHSSISPEIEHSHKKTLDACNIPWTRDITKVLNI